ncbi:MAG TPA: hypothetical protein VHE09_13600 [Rhizomicrobium sp.]|nr:hypothetical protein [Rhizomicrobium sp.]
MDIIDSWWAIIRDGLYHINPIQFVIIGLLFGFGARSIGAAVFGAVFASVVYIAVNVLWPVVVNRQPFAMPVLDTPFWHFFLALTFAFLVVTLLFFIVRSIIDSIRG